MRAYVFVSLVIAVVIVASSVAQVSAAPEPAIAYCIRQGYRIEATYDNESSGLNCVFPNGSKCGEWAFYDGKCGLEYRTYEPIPPRQDSPVDPFIYVAIITGVAMLSFLLLYLFLHHRER